MVLINVLEIIAPVLVLALVGLIWSKTGLDYNVQFVTRLSMSLGMPCLIFVSLMNTGIRPQNLLNVSLATLVVYALITLLTFILITVVSAKKQTYLAPIIFGNTGNIGLPLSYFAFGSEGFDYAVIIFALMTVYAFTFGI